MDILVGYTGFVGSNLCRQHGFTGLFNSKNISEAAGTAPDLCVYSGVYAEKFTADKFPETDLMHIGQTLENIKKIKAARLVLISTVDVIPAINAEDIYEDTRYKPDTLSPYGRHRLFLETEIRRLYPDTACIIRLPGLFGRGLKKNFIYDLINFIPAALNPKKFEELNRDAADKGVDLNNFYTPDENGFFRLNPGIPEEKRAQLKTLFEQLNFSALNFTDSRAVYQFYNLDYLWEHIQFAQNSGTPLLHLAVEPVSAGEVYKAVKNTDFKNEITPNPPRYDYFKSRHAALLGGGGDTGYIFNKLRVLNEIKKFALLFSR